MVSSPLPEDNFTAKLITAVQGVMDEYYVEKTRQNVNRGLKENAKLGFSRGSLPIGYKRQRQPNGKSLIVKDEEGGRIYLMVVDMFLIHGKGSVEIAKILNQSNFKNAKDKPFKKNVVLKLLKNKIYKGEIALDSEDPESEVFEHPHLAYIEKDKWDAIPQELENRTKAVSESAAPSIFGTLLQCACGGTIRTDSTNKNGKQHYYYACKSRGGDSVVKCNQERFRQDLIDKFLLDAILEKVFTDEALAELEKYLNMELDYYRAEATKDKPDLKVKINDIERKLGNLYKAIADGVIEATDIATMLTDLKQEKKVIERRLDKIEENIDISFRLTLTQAMIKELVEKVRSEQNVNVCRRLMRNIIDKIVVKGKTFSIYYSDKVIMLTNGDNDPDDDFDGGNGGNGGNKNSPNNGNNGSGSSKNLKSSLRDGLVGRWELNKCLSSLISS
jgi:Recombinase